MNLHPSSPLLLKQRRSPLLITCTVLCVSLMGTGASHPVKRLPLSALDKDGQLDIAECDLLRTEASKLSRHDPLLPEQRGAPLLITCGSGSKVSSAVPHRNFLHRSTTRALFQQTSH